MTEKMTRRIIDTTEKGKILLEKYKNEVDVLANITYDIMQDNPVLLLSPIYREMVRKQAKEVKDLHSKLQLHLCVDYLHE